MLPDHSRTPARRAGRRRPGRRLGRLSRRTTAARRCGCSSCCATAACRCTLSAPRGAALSTPAVVARPGARAAQLQRRRASTGSCSGWRSATRSWRWPTWTASSCSSTCTSCCWCTARTAARCARACRRSRCTASSAAPRIACARSSATRRRARLRHPAIPDMQLALRVVDVSAGGCALSLPERRAARCSRACTLQRCAPRTRRRHRPSPRRCSCSTCRSLQPARQRAPAGLRAARPGRPGAARAAALHRPHAAAPARCWCALRPVAPRPRRERAGFTLVEMVGRAGRWSAMLAALAWPPLHEQLSRSRRADGVAALMRVQIAQESYRAHTACTRRQLSALGGAGGALSAEGLYRIELQRDGAARYRVSATPRAGRAQAGDRLCPVLQLRVDDGRAEHVADARAAGTADGRAASPARADPDRADGHARHPRACCCRWRCPPSAASSRASG